MILNKSIKNIYSRIFYREVNIKVSEVLETFAKVPSSRCHMYLAQANFLDIFFTKVARIAYINI